MKVHDSGMPEETYWNSLFDIAGIVEWLEINDRTGGIAEIGCGYGTFTVPVALTSGKSLLAFDIEPDMIATARHHVVDAGLSNVQFFLRDVLETGTGLAEGSVGLVLLFNLLHFPERRILLEEASRILRTHGRIAIIHWRKDIPTPRGPVMEVRPDQQDILQDIQGLALQPKGDSVLLGPYHWGMQLVKTAALL